VSFERFCHEQFTLLRGWWKEDARRGEWIIEAVRAAEACFIGLHAGAGAVPRGDGDFDAGQALRLEEETA
jgi:hypothetical protein